MDDLVSGATDYNKGVELYRYCKFRLLEANFNLEKWQTNNKELHKVINDAEEFSSDNTTVNVLGINWNVYTDSFEINLNYFFT